MRHWKLFKLLDEEKEPALAVDAIHHERGYREIRRSLARQYDVGWTEPDIQVVDVDMAGDRHLKLEHAVTNGILLAQSDAEQVVQHLANLWGYGTVLSEVDREGGKMLTEYRASPDRKSTRLISSHSCASRMPSSA